MGYRPLWEGCCFVPGVGVVGLGLVLGGGCGCGMLHGWSLGVSSPLTGGLESTEGYFGCEVECLGEV